MLDHKIKYKKSIPEAAQTPYQCAICLFELKLTGSFCRSATPPLPSCSKTPDETAEPAPETLTDPLEPTKIPSLGSELNAFTFLKIANHFFKDFEFEPSKGRQLCGRYSPVAAGHDAPSSMSCCATRLARSKFQAALEEQTLTRPSTPSP